MASLIAELTDKRDPEWLAFWRDRHPLEPSAAGFDPDMPLHRVWCEWDGYGRILSACMFVPMVQGGQLLGHHAYLASHRISKGLVTFCRESMKQIEGDENFGLVSVETRQDGGLRCIDKLAKFLGFSPVRYPGMEWTDYIWNSKERTAVCHH